VDSVAPKQINAIYWTICDIHVCVEATAQSTRIALNISSNKWVIVSVIVVVLPGLLIIVLPREPEVVLERAESLGILIRRTRPKTHLDATATAAYYRSGA